MVEKPTLKRSYSLGIRPEIATPEEVWDFCNIAPGWSDLIRRLLIDLDKPDMKWSCTIHQVKEKFGGLRFYVGAANRAVSNRIEKAEKEAARTCDVCGNPGVLRAGGWMVTRCAEHSDGRKPTKLFSI